MYREANTNSEIKGIAQEMTVAFYIFFFFVCLSDQIQKYVSIHTCVCPHIFVDLKSSMHGRD